MDLGAFSISLLIAAFGPLAKHARAAIGAASLPIGLTVEIEMLVEIEEELDEAP